MKSDGFWQPLDDVMYPLKYRDLPTFIRFHPNSSLRSTIPNSGHRPGQSSSAPTSNRTNRSPSGHCREKLLS
jgi:hypothetical protein